MNVKRLLFWGALFCLLFLYVVLFERPEIRNDDKFVDDIVKVFSGSPEDIKEIHVIHNAKKSVLVKKFIAWKIAFPPDKKLSKPLIESLISAVLDTVNIEVIEERPAGLAQYGLANPLTKVSVLSKNNNTPTTLLLGNDSPTGVSTYAMIQGEEKVILIGNFLRFSINNFMEKI